MVEVEQTGRVVGEEGREEGSAHGKHADRWEDFGFHFECESHRRLTIRDIL